MHELTSLFLVMLKTYFAHDQKLPRLWFLSIVHVEMQGHFVSYSRLKAPETSFLLNITMAIAMSKIA